MYMLTFCGIRKDLCGISDSMAQIAYQLSGHPEHIHIKSWVWTTCLGSYCPLYLFLAPYLFGQRRTTVLSSWNSLKLSYYTALSLIYEFYQDYQEEFRLCCLQIGQSEYTSLPIAMRPENSKEQIWNSNRLASSSLLSSPHSAFLLFFLNLECNWNIILTSCLLWVFFITYILSAS